MKYLLILLVVVIVIYAIFGKRKIDFFLISTFSIVVYYYPALIGEIYGAHGDTNITFDTYFCIILYTVSLLYYMIINDRYNLSVYKYKPKSDFNNTAYYSMINNYTIIILDLLGMVLLIYTMGKYGDIRHGFNKMQMLANANRLTEYLKYIALFAFVCSFISDGKGNRIARILSCILLGYTFVLGHRSFMVIGCIAIFIQKIESGEKVVFFEYIRKYKKAILGITVLATVILFIKGVFSALITGQYDLVKSRLEDPEYYRATLLSSEANVITYNLKKVCESGMRYSFFQYFLGLFCLVPVLGGRIGTWLEYTSFERMLNLNFNSRLDEGVGIGSTYLGEAYAVGGFLFVIVQSWIAFFIMSWLMKMRQKHIGKGANTLCLIILSYFSFYIHRNSLIFLLITARAYLYILIMYVLIQKVLIGTLTDKGLRKEV